MKTGRNLPRKALMALVLAGVGFSVVPATAVAQDDEARLRKVEAELRALQRVVFPNSDGRFFTPEVSTSNPAPTVQAGTPATSALTDVLGRLEAMEGQMARITAANEENSAAVRGMQTRLAELEARNNAAVTTAPSFGGAAPSTPLAANSGAAPLAQAPARPATPAATTPAATTPAAAAPSAARLAGVQAILKPATDDAGDDEYTYGFRLWDAKFFPEARQQLALFLEKYPRHKQASFGRNLLGRAYLDDGDARNAATHFLANYQADKQGARAGDSLLYLADAMIALNDTNRACIALATFGDEYPALAVGRLKAQYDRNRAKVTCN